MSEVLAVGGHPLTYGGFLLGFIDPNPLNLPAYTMRFLFDDLSYNPRSYNWGYSGTWTQVSSDPNIWDFTKTSLPTNWDNLFYCPDPLLPSDIISFEDVPGEILGANTSGVTSMVSTFKNANKFRSVALFDTSSITDMEYMFEGCSTLTTVPQFDTRSVSNMHRMFYRCSSLSSVPLFNTANVTSMSGMFNDCTSLTLCSTLPMLRACPVCSMVVRPLQQYLYLTLEA